MTYNFLGVAFVDEELGTDIEKLVENKMEELRGKAMQEFDAFLDKNNLEQIMGVIVQKGSIK